MSRSFFSNCVGEDYINQNTPNNVVSNTSNRLPKNYNLLKYFNLEDAKERTFYEADVYLDVEKIYNSSGKSISSAEITIEIYSLPYSLSAVTYNNFMDSATKHKWYGTTGELKKTIVSGSYQKIKLDEGVTGIAQAINSGGYVVLCIKASSAEILFDDSGYMDVCAYSFAPILDNLKPAGTSIYKNKQQKFTWKYDGDGSEQKSYEIGWSSDDGNTWNSQTIASSEKSHTFAAETFPEGIIRWRVKATAEEGLSSKYYESEFSSVAQRPTVSIGFPDGINISNEKEQIFTWDYSGEDLEQISYEIGISSDDGENWDSFEVESSNTYHVFEANSFTVGQLLWRIRVINSAGYSSDYAYGKFGSVGQSAAPIIESVSQNAIPTITWTSLEQEAFEIQIIGSNVYYESGMIPDSDIRSFRPNLMLENGRYEFRIRILNSYGRISEWTGKTVWLNAQEPNSHPILMLKENDLYGVSLSGSGVTGRGFYVRKEKRYQTKIYETTYMITDTAWETKSITVGDCIEEIDDIAAAGYFVHKQQVEKGDILTLCSGWYISSPDYLYSDRLIVTNLDHIVVDTVLFDDLDDVREYIFDGDGYFFLCAVLPNSSGISLFEIQKMLNMELPESFADKETIIAEYAEGVTVIDCDLQPGRKYLYALRDYVEGYIESSEKTYACDFDGVVFHDIENLENMVHIRLNKEEYVKVENSLSKNTVYKQCSGREFPVKETNIQKTERIDVTGFLNVKEFRKAYELFCTDKIVLLRNENHCCYADICDFKKEEFFGMGYIVKIGFERIDKNEEVNLV